MSIQDKFDTVLKANKLGVNSIFGLEKHCGVGVGSVSKYLSSGESPKLGTIKKIQDVMKINPEWWDTGKGEIFLTSVPKANDNKESEPMRENVYRTIVEGNTEYVLIPRTVLNEVQLISTKQLENDRRVMDKLLDQNEKLIAKVIKLEPQLPGVKEGQ